MELRGTEKEKITPNSHPYRVVFLWRKTKMANERLIRIAQTGEIEPEQPLSPVDKLVSQANIVPEQAEPATDPSFWNKTRRFLGTDLGRSLLGGLGTAAAVGLTGGSAQDALGYGVIGAGNTVENLNNQRQQEQNLALKYQQEFKPTEKLKNFEFIKNNYGDAAAKQYLLGDNQPSVSNDEKLYNFYISKGFTNDEALNMVSALRRKQQAEAQLWEEAVRGNPQAQGIVNQQPGSPVYEQELIRNAGGLSAPESAINGYTEKF